MPPIDTNSLFLNTLTGSGYGNGAVGNDPSLNAFSRTIGQNDYWKQAAAPIGAAKFNTSTWDPGTTAAVTGAQGFLSALLSGYGSQQEASQLDAVRQVLPDIRAGVDVPIPDGVDPEAFQGLKLSAAQDLFATKQKEKEALKQVLDSNLMTTDDSGKVVLRPGVDEALREKASAVAEGKQKPPLDLTNASPDWKEALVEAGGDTVLARQLMKQSAANQGTLQGLSNSIAVIKSLDDLKSMAYNQTFGGKDSILPDYVAGVGNTIAGKLDAGSNAATFNSAVIPITDSLLRALTQVGRGGQYTQSQIKDDLQDAWGKGPDALAARIDNYKRDLINSAQQRASDLVGNSYGRAKPILDTVMNLTMDGSNSISNLTSAPTAVAPATDMASFIALAKAQGLTKDQAKMQWLQRSAGGQ